MIYVTTWKNKNNSRESTFRCNALDIIALIYSAMSFAMFFSELHCIALLFNALHFIVLLYRWGHLRLRRSIKCCHSSAQQLPRIDVPKRTEDERSLWGRTERAGEKISPGFTSFKSKIRGPSTLLRRNCVETTASGWNPLANDFIL